MATPSLRVIGLVVVILIMILWLAVRNRPVTTPSGGTTTVDHPATELPPSGVSAGTTAGITVPPAAAFVPIAKIRVLKDTTGQQKPLNDNNDWRDINIGEIFAYSNNTLLTAPDYSSATMSPGTYGLYSASNVLRSDRPPTTFAHSAGDGPVHMLELTLASPRPIQRVEVFNRMDCCQTRLAGALIQMLDANGVVAWQGTLNSDKFIKFECTDPTSCRSGKMVTGRYV